MLIFNKVILFIGNILIGIYIIIIAISGQWGSIPPALVIALVYTLLVLYWRSTILIDIEDEKEIENVK